MLCWTDSAGVAQSLTQSLAILEFLCDALDRSGVPSLLPNDATGRMRCREIAEVINSGTQPLQNLAQLRALEAKWQHTHTTQLYGMYTHMHMDRENYTGVHN